MKKSNISIPNLLFTFLFMFILPISGFADTTLHSSTALDTIFQQSERTYLRALGSNTQEAISNAPEVFASLVGLTMQQQFEQLRDYRNRAYSSHYEALKDEALDYMAQLAQAHSYRNPADGSNMPADRLMMAFLNGLKLDTSKLMFGTLNPNDVKFPFILSQVELPANSGGDERGRLYVKPNNEINFLGIVAPPAEGDSPYVGKLPEKTSQPEPNVYTQKNNVPTATLTGCSSAKFTIKKDMSTLAAATYSYYRVLLKFNNTATIFPYITKVVVTYNNRLKREMDKDNSVHYNEWGDYFSLPGYSPKKHGPLKLTFEAYNDQGEVICRGKTQK